MSGRDCTAGTEQLESHRHFHKLRCLLRQSEASYFQANPLVQHNWDPRSDPIKCRIAPDLQCTRFLSQDAPNKSQERTRKWEEGLGHLLSRLARALAEVLLGVVKSLVYSPPFRTLTAMFMYSTGGRGHHGQRGIYIQRLLSSPTKGTFNWFPKCSEPTAAQFWHLTSVNNRHGGLVYKT